jgi:hypothetical protein
VGFAIVVVQGVFRLEVRAADDAIVFMVLVHRSLR